MSQNKPKKMLNKDTEKRLDHLNKEKNDTIRNLEKRHKKDIDKIISNRTAKKGRFNFLSKPEAEKLDDPRYWSMVNVESLKEFIKYGSNKVLDQIRVRSQANTIAREEIDKLKKKTDGPDAKSIIYNIMYITIIGAIALVIAINFMNYNDITKQLTDEKVNVGTVSGQLAACQSELASYKPGMVVNPPIETTGDEGPDNVLEG